MHGEVQENTLFLITVLILEMHIIVTIKNVCGLDRFINALFINDECGL